MKRSYLFVAMLGTAILFQSCKKQDLTPAPSGTQSGTGSGSGSGSGTGVQKPALSYQLTAINRSAGIAQKTTGATVTWDSGFANPVQIKFEAKRNGSEVEFKSNSAAQIDLMAPVAASFGNVTLDTGLYSEIELRINLNKTATAPALQLRGTFTDSTFSVPLLFRIDDAIELRTEQQNVTITSTSLTATTTLNLSGFTAGITKSMIVAAQLTNGILVISKNANKSLYDIILNNINNMHHGCGFHH